MKTGEDGYRETCEMTMDVVERAKSSGPKFRFPPRDVALIASISDVGGRLAENTAAAELLAALEAETLRRKLADFPTAMMLRGALELTGIPIRFVSLEEFGLSAPPGEN